MKIRIRLLRHKHKNWFHSWWLLMIQSKWPIIVWKHGPPEFDEIAHLIDSPQKSSFDVILERYNERGCVYPPILGLSL